MSADRRRHVRERVRQRAWFETPERTLYARVFELSLSGLSTRTPSPFAQGDVVVVSLGQRVRARARVVWSRGLPSGGMGVEFLEVTAGQDELAAMVDEAGRMRRVGP